MPSINPALLNSHGLTGTNDTQSSHNQLSPDDFITLFLAQLKNQNPMQPTDSSQVLQQMAEITSIQTAKDMQKSMADLENNIDSTLGKSQVLQASQLIGKKVEIQSDYSYLDADDGLSGSVGVPSSASNVQVSIKDQTGAVVDKIDLGPTTSSGLVDFSWDGTIKNQDGTTTKLPPGNYSISATATIGDKTQDLPVAGAFKVKSVALDQTNGNVNLNLNSYGGISIDQIIKIM